MMRPFALAILLIGVAAPAVLAQPVFTGPEIFPPEEFAARRARVFEAIGDGLAGSRQ